MALKFNKDATLKKNTNLDFIGEDGIYDVTIAENEVRVEEFEGRNKGSKYHNLKVMFANGKTKYIKIYYENAEGDIDPAGYNFLLSLRNILVDEYEQVGKDTAKVLAADSNQIIGVFIKNKMPIWLAFRQNKFNDNVYFNLNKFINPMGSVSEADEVGSKKNLKVINLEEELEAETLPEAVDDWDDEDDL